MKTMLGDGALATDPNQKLRVRINPETKKLDIELLYNKVMHDDGSYSVSIDQRRAGDIPGILQKIRKDAGLPTYTEQELAAKTSEIIEHHMQTIENPCVVHHTEIKNFERGLLKIAYELAFMWLGEKYICSDTASRLRSAILDDKPYPEVDIQCPHDHDVFWIWGDDKNSHIAFTNEVDGVLIVCIRVFDILSARVVIRTKDDLITVTWPTGGRFLSNDPVTKAKRDTTFFDECGRITKKVLSGDAETQAMVFGRMRGE